MDTAVFLSKILSDEGLIVLAEFRGGAMKRHHFLPNFDEASKKVHALNDTGAEVYHACATYKSDANRKQDNVARVKSLWVDIDVGKADGYQTRNEAKDALGDVCKALGFHLPTIVSSGKGLHCYWLFDAAVTGEVWKVGANKFRQALDLLGFKHDPSCTADVTRILRPVGSTWRKAGEKPVKLLLDSKSEAFGWYTSQIDKFLGVNAPASVSLSGPSRKFFDLIPVEKLGRVAEYPPSSAHQIADKCGQISRMREFKGAVSELEWRNAIGLIKHTIEGEDLCHEWSQGDPRYDAAETQQKLDNWKTPPTTCAQFEIAASHICGGCKFKGKVNSPIGLGYVATQEVPVELTQPDGVSIEEINYFEMFPVGYKWENNHLQRLVEDKDGVPHWISFSDTLFYPTTRIKLEDETWAQRVRMQVAKGRWREFEMPTKYLSNSEQIRAQLAAYEIVIHPRMGQHAIDYTNGWLNQYKELAIEMQLYKEYGWHLDGTGFLVGDNLITEKHVSKVGLAKRVPDTLRVLGGDGVAGSESEWARVFNHVYDRPNAEVYQFTAMGLLSAPIVGLLGIPDWHGIPIALTGAGGQGKTALGLAACSAYGIPSAFMLGCSTATINSFDPHIGVLHHLPCIFDEVTGRESTDISTRLYAVSSGVSKPRATVTGESSSVKFTWDTISLITANTNITELLAKLDFNQADASQVRVFEYSVPEGTLNKVFGGVDAQNLITSDLGQKNYGAAGRVALRDMMFNRSQIRADFESYRKKFGIKSDNYDPKERFYVDLVATAYVGGRRFKELGLLTYDIDNAKDWALDQIVNMRNSRAENAYIPEDKLAQFLASLHGNLLVTKNTNLSVEAPMESFQLRGEVKARMATTERKFYVSLHAFESWCFDNKLQPGILRKDLMQQGFIVPHEDRMSLTKNTSIPSSRQRVIAFSYDKIMISEAGKDISAKVVSIK